MKLRNFRYPCVSRYVLTEPPSEDGKWQMANGKGANGKSENFFLRLGPKCSSWQRTNQLHVRSLRLLCFPRPFARRSPLDGQRQPRAVSGFSTKEVVGRLSTNRLYTPVNQMLTPAGLQIELPGLRPQALALSPDGKLLVTAGKRTNWW